MKFYLKESFFAVILLGCLTSCNNNSNKTKPHYKSEDTTKTVSSYKLDVPAGWNVERIPFPIDFAPGINYTGVEDLRFTPGWEDLTSEEHWSYAFLWWLDGRPKIDTDILQENLTQYYSGLIKRNIVQRSIPQIKIVPTVVTIKKTETTTGDSATYSGTVSMLDYIAQKPIILNCLVHVKSCGTQKHTPVFFEISPRPYDHQMWQQLNSLELTFKCEE